MSWDKKNIGMDLLPKSSQEFSSQRYWDLFFSKRKEDPFEWYGEYPELAEHLHKYIRPNDNLLIVGCGNSTLSFDLFNAGIKNQKSLDISSVVVSQMKAKYPQIDIIEGDVTAMTFPDLSFSCVLDKGTFDALSPPPKVEKRNKTEFDEPNGEELVKVDLMMNEISRTLKSGGRFICVSLLQPHVASRLLSHFHSLGWMVRVVRCLDAERKTAEKAAAADESKAIVFPVFMSIFTKLSLPGTVPILEASSPSSAATLKRFGTLEELLAFIKEQQNFALVQKRLNQLGSCSEDELQLQLGDLKTGQTRYILNIVDVPKLLTNSVKQMFGVFIVPQGRESEWLFGTHEGQKTLAIQANFTRLVVIHLVRGQIYSDMHAIQEELKGPLASLSPSCVKEKGIKSPIMTLGNDVGNRVIIHNGHSEFSGDFVVEDVNCDGQLFRRLIFLNSPNLIQSEAEIVVVHKRGKEFKNPVTNKLSCQYHGLMTMSFGLLKYFFNQVESTNALLVGLGGGLLASFLNSFIPNLALSVVEIDPEIVSVAKSYFGLSETDRLKIIVDDGLKFIQSTESQYNVILLDVDNKSTKEGLSCPPPDFLEIQTLQHFKQRMASNSLFVINLVCRNEELKKTYLNLVQQQFPFILQCDVPSEVNTLLFCFSKKVDDKFNLRNISAHVKSSIDLVISSSSGIQNSQVGKQNKKDKNQQAKCNPDIFSDVFDDLESLINNFKVLKIQ